MSLISGNIYLRVEINDINKEISQADAKIRELNSKQVSLEMQLENLFSYKTLWEKAEEMGMQKRSDSQLHLIDTGVEDYAEIIE